MIIIHHLINNIVLYMLTYNYGTLNNVLIINDLMMTLRLRFGASEC